MDRVQYHAHVDKVMQLTVPYKGAKFIEYISECFRHKEDTIPWR